MHESTYPLRTRHHIGQSHSNRKLSLITHHCNQLHQSLKPICQHCFCQGIKLCPLLQDFGEHFHKRGSCLEVFVVAQAWWREGSSAKEDVKAGGRVMHRAGGLPMECMRPLSTLALSRLDMASTVQWRSDASRRDMPRLRPPAAAPSSSASLQSFSRFMNRVKYLGTALVVTRALAQWCSHSKPTQTSPTANPPKPHPWQPEHSKPMQNSPTAAIIQQPSPKPHPLCQSHNKPLKPHPYPKEPPQSTAQTLTRPQKPPFVPDLLCPFPPTLLCLYQQISSKSFSFVDKNTIHYQMELIH